MDCIVELTDDEYTTQLPFENSLKVVDHSPDSSQWVIRGAGLLNSQLLS